MKRIISSQNATAKYASYAITIAVICLTGFTGTDLAHNTNKATKPGDADIKVSGTSNLHHWTMEAKDISCSTKFNFLPGNDRPESLTALTFRCRFRISETLMHHKEQHQQSDYYKKFGETIKEYEHVVLFGPTDAKVELLNVLRADHRFEKIKIEVKQADKITDNQQHTFVRDYFSQPRLK
jgi:hypothetical protein